MAIPEQILGRMTAAETHALWSQQIIEHAVDFYFEGTPRAYMMFDLPRGQKNLSYKVYALLGRDQIEVVRALTEEVRAALSDKRHSIGPICLIWRARPEVEHMADSDMFRVYMRFVVVDTDFNEIDIEVATRDEGDPTPVMETNPNV